MSWYTCVLLINKPLPLAVAFKIPVPEALTTFNAFPYCKNELAEKKDSKVVELGLPKISTSSLSDETVVTSSKGPLTKSPAKAPK